MLSFFFLNYITTWELTLYGKWSRKKWREGEKRISQCMTEKVKQMKKLLKANKKKNGDSCLLQTSAEAYRVINIQSLI